MSGLGDFRWVKSTANELNNLLQVIAESSEQLAQHGAGDAASEKYLGMLRTSVQRAVAVTRTFTERLGDSFTDPIAPTGLPDGNVRLFPADRMPQLAAGAPVETLQIHNPAGSRELVMIVDDEDFVTQLASYVLSNEGYRVVTAKDGLQAIEIYKRLRSEIALVILDFTMPVMDGSDVFTELQRMDPDVSVVLSSGFAEQDRLRSMLARGLKGFIPKPYSNQKLLDQVRQTLDTISAVPR